ncbi:membrane protein [Paenibacillus swuensis]|uniref:Membrane protein n=1 Tax=Paenibacillus swuensis TaxID=1178515 RepID=A0A172TJT0_9BACL|nr:MMPL family transporter [Paenibacillus swuensis]ANE47226.1 membrane protein [Paenibacillus swuensis]
MSQEEHFLGRFGQAIAGKRTRWVTIIVWVALVVVLNMLFPQANSQTVENAPNLAEDRPSVVAEKLAKEQFPNESGVPALIVFHREGGMQDADLTKAGQIAEYFTATPLPNQTLIPPLHKLPPPVLKQQLSEDGSTLVLPIFFDKSADVEQLKESIELFEEKTSEIVGGDVFEASITSGDALSARVTGPVGIQIDATGLFESADVTLLIATVLLVLVLLLLIYRSPILAIIPLIGVGFAYGVISPVLGWLAEQGWITFDSQGISIMTVLLFGAGTDYCLFLVARFRQELKEQENRFTALRSAITGATGAVAMSGFTVVVSLLALLLAEYGSYQRFAIPFSLSILIMMIASITLVPALLAVFGRASFFPFVPRTAEMQRERARKKGKPEPKLKQEGKLGRAVGSLVTRRPWAVTLVTLILLGAMASFATQVKINFDTLSSFPEDIPSREGFSLIGKQFSEGELAPVKVMVDTEGKTIDLKSGLEGLDYVSKVGEPVKGAVDPNIVAYDVEFTMNPYSNEAMDRLPDLRGAVEKSLADAGVTNAADNVFLGGQTADQLDTKETTESDTARIIPVVIVLIAFILVVYLRSIVAMLYLMGTVLLSYFSALGIGWIIIHYGMGADFIQGSIPLYVFVFLVALGEDYNIFMISSIWEKRRTMPLNQAIKDGVAQTGGVITSAGLILAGTFAVLASLPIQVLVHFGLITAIGVLLDTFIVRPFLVPALTTLLGKRAFWPGKYEPVAEKHELTS